jgi:hypothetical protein
MPVFARRFRRNALFVAIAAVLALIALFVLGTVLAVGADPVAGIPAWGAAVALAIAVVVFAVNSLRRSRAIRDVMTTNPGGLVFLGRRQPSLVSDLATYIPDSEVLAEVSDRWVIASVDGRGMTAWSIGAHARELVLMPWADIGSVERVRLEGSGRPGIAVDVQPFPTPLVVSVGYSAFGVMAPYGKQGVDEIVIATNALRPDTLGDKLP